MRYMTSNKIEMLTPEDVHARLGVIDAFYRAKFISLEEHVSDLELKIIDLEMRVNEK